MLELILRMCTAGMTTDVLSLGNIGESILALIVAALLLSAHVIVFVVFAAIGWWFWTIVKKVFLWGFGK